MIFNVHDAIKNFLTFQIRAQNLIAKSEKLKMFLFNMLPCLIGAAKAEGSLHPYLLWLRPGRLVILRYLVRLVSGGRFPPESTHPPTLSQSTIP